MSTGFLVSITPIAPSTRTSATVGRSLAGSSSSLNWRAIAGHPILPGAVQQQPDRGAGHMAGKRIAHEGRAVHENARSSVGDGGRHLGRCQGGGQGHGAAGDRLADADEYPEQTPACSAAKSLPVRPKPVAISSKISSTSILVAQSPQAPQIVGMIEPHAARALDDRLNDDRRRLLMMRGEHLLHGRQVDVHPSRRRNGRRAGGQRSAAAGSARTGCACR